MKNEHEKILQGTANRLIDVSEKREYWQVYEVLKQIYRMGLEEGRAIKAAIEE